MRPPFLDHTQLVNPGFTGGAAAGSLLRASFSPDGRFVVSGSEKGQVRVWEAQQGKRVRSPLQVSDTLDYCVLKSYRELATVISSWEISYLHPIFLNTTQGREECSRICGVPLDVARACSGAALPKRNDPHRE